MELILNMYFTNDGFRRTIILFLQNAFERVNPTLFFNRKDFTMKLTVIVIQILFIHVFLFLGAALKEVIPLPIPGSMFGLILLFLALYFRIVKLEWVERGQNG